MFALLLGQMSAAVQPAAAQQAPRLLVLSPLEGEELGPEAIIAISFIDPDRRIDLKSIMLAVDGKDVTGKATVTGGVVTYVPSAALGPGHHRFELRLWDVEGEELPGLREEFQVGGEVAGEERWGIAGRATLDLLVDDFAGSQTAESHRQEPPNTRTMRVNTRGHWGVVKYRGNLFITSEESGSFQPRNRYSFHADAGWAAFDLGDVNYRFSDLVLRGKRTRGLGGRLRWGGFELTALRGQIKRGIEGFWQVDSTRYLVTADTTITIPVDTTITDTTATDTTLYSTTAVGATYERDLLGMRLAWERGRTWLVGLDVLRVRDDLRSIEVGLLPKDNLVLGGDLLFAPFKRRLILESNWAFSMVTEDISGGALSEDEIEDLVEGTDIPFDPLDFDHIFIINATTRPLDPRDLSSLAWNTSLRGNLWGQAFSARYQRTGAAFSSLAAPSVLSDRAGIKLSDTFHLLQKHLQVSGDYENFHDNLSDDKDFTTDTNILGVTATVQPRRVDLTHVTLGYRLYMRDNDADAPATGETDHRVDENTSTYHLGTGYHFWYRQGHDISVSFMFSDRGGVQSESEATQTDWSLGWTTRFERIPLVLELGYGNNHTKYSAADAAVSEVEYRHWLLRWNYGFWEGELETFGDFRQVFGSSDRGVYAADKTSFEAGARYRLNSGWGKGAVLTGSVGLVSFDDKVDPDSLAQDDYDETIFKLRLVQEF